MKTNKLLKTLALAAGIGAAAPAFAAGDIFEIRPWSAKDGTNRTEWASLDAPLGSGETVFFNVRLQSRYKQTTSGDYTWYVDHVGSSSQLVDDALYPLEIGIYVSGELRYAKLVNTVTRDNGNYTDLIFSYTTKPGDFALPVVLATSDGVALDQYEDSDESYTYLLGQTDKWTITNGAGQKCAFRIGQNWAVTQGPDGKRVTDYSLSKAGIYVQTVDFDDEWEAEASGLWRSVHEKSTITVGGTPSIVATGASEEAHSYYVWSTDESAVTIKGGEGKYITIDAAGTPEWHSVGTVTIQGGALSADFAIQGVTEGSTCNLVLSPWDDYRYSTATATRIQDYVTVGVACIEPMPPTAVVEFDRTIAYADTNYTTYAAVMTVYLSQACTEDVTVTLTPSFADGDTTAVWSDYVRFSDTADTVASIAILGTDVPTVTIPAGSTDTYKFYVYALKSDAHTTGTSSIIVTPAASSAEVTAVQADALDVQSVTPVITAVQSQDATGEITVEGICGDALDFQLAVADSYANSADTATGYKIYIKYRSTDKFVALDGVYYVGENNILYELTDDGAGGYNKSTTLPQITYPASSGDTVFASQVYVINPVNTKKSDTVTFSADISDARTSLVEETTGTDIFNEGEQGSFQISISEANDTGNTIYAFLKASDNVTADMFSGTPMFVVCDDSVSSKTKGLAINKYQTTTSAAKIKFLDGLSEDAGGLSITFEVVLCSTQNYSESTVLSGYDSNYLNITVVNKEPSITRIEMNGNESEADGYTYPNSIPKNMERTFVGIVTDAGQYDLKTEVEEDLFQCKWSASLSGVGTVTNAVIKGNPANNPFTYDFPRSGVWTVKLQVKDKDMDDWSATTYSVNVNVLDNPVIEVTVPDAVAENDLSQPVTLAPSYWDTMYTGELTVKVTVSEYSAGRDNPGILKLDSNYASTVDGEDGVYYITFSDALPKDISFQELDGTDVSSIYGFTITAEVVSTDVLPTSGTAANEYYLADSARVLVNNVEPVCSASPNENTNRWEVAGGLATAHPIRWSVTSDVDGDFAGIDSFPGVKVTITGCDNGFERYVTEATTETFIPNFGDKQGDYDVILTIEDKDGGVVTWTWQFTITPSKFLNTVATGPSGDVAGSGSNSYAGNGRGQGHVYVGNGATFSSAENFRISWNCANAAQVWLYGFGYKIAAPVDNGWLDNELDQAISTAGGTATKPAIATVTDGYYTYAEAKLDSFLYAWIWSTASSDATATEWNKAFMIERPGQGVDQHVVNLPSESTEDGNFIPVTAIGIFSREFFAADNLGDINQDGIPDFFAHADLRGGNLIELAAGGADADEDVRLTNDMTDLADLNPANDMLPAVYNNPLSASYAPIGTPFNVYMQIRGFGDGLNAQDVTTSDPDFTADEITAYNAATGSAITQSAEADLTKWSPEPTGTFARMDPTILDTDGDGFYDGWEYYFWYLAKVWAPANNADFGQPRPGQDNVFERFNTANILVGTAISNDDVLGHFNPCTRVAAGGDFDNDGLSDMEEFVLGTNPCHWDTDGDRICDGWEVMMSLDPLYGGNRVANADGDYMAFFNLAHSFVIVGDNGTEGATAENIDEGTVIYVPEFQAGDIAEGVVSDAADGQVRRCWRFTPKFVDSGAERVRRVYGIRHTQLPDDSDNWNVLTTTYPEVDDNGVATQAAAWGLFMVDEVASKTTKGEPYTITLHAGQIVTEGLDYVLIHDQVRDAFGFDPRTAWFMTENGYVADRWDPANNADVETGLAVNTRPYTDWDEYLLMQYRYDYRINYNEISGLDGTPANTWLWFANKTTMPNIVEEAAADEEEEEDADAEEEEDTTTAIQERAAALDAALAESGSTKTTLKGHGADTDGDGVPDGWEVYMYRNPNAAPNALDETNDDLDSDGLNYALEFAGTDSCNAYEECETVYANHPGVNNGWFNKFFPTNPGTISENAINEELGTVERVSYAGADSPDGADTDGDGIIDSREGQSWTEAFYHNGVLTPNTTFNFIYGTPEDDGSCCIRGGGMNPCTIDTDLDGLPDGWEMQHAGIAAQAQVTAAAEGAEDAQQNLDNPTRIADGLGIAPEEEEGEGGEETVTTVTYIAGGMDATWRGDAFTDMQEGGASTDGRLGTTRDVDFDHDGLQNYQEYLVQSLRHFRYDDITTPLMGRMLSEAAYEAGEARALMDGVTHSQTFYGFVPFDPVNPGTLIANATAAWGEDEAAAAFEALATHLEEQAAKVEDADDAPVITWQATLDEDGWRELGYFAPPIHSWDRAVASQILESPVYMFPLRGQMAIDDTTHVATGYISTDPRMADTDGDGMDDYWELFHGLDPIMGGQTGAAVEQTTQWVDGKSGDILAAVYDRWNVINGQGASLELFNGYRNEWVWPDYCGNAKLGLGGDEFPEAIEAPQCFDPVFYPWIMGLGIADADNDGIRNQDEYITANVTEAMPLHTDPTPLWMTERTTAASYVRQYYPLSGSLGTMPWYPSPAGTYEEVSVVGNSPEWMYSFAESEGFDTDNDWSPDHREATTTSTAATDPLRFNDPDRRQALWLPGTNACAMSFNLQSRPGLQGNSDFLKQFTVECWVMPTEKGRAQTILERSVMVPGNSILKDAAAIRANFRIGLSSEGIVYGMFDNNDSKASGLDESISCQRVNGLELPLNEWSHVALSYNGEELVIYVDGERVKGAATHLAPANGISAVTQNFSSTNAFPVLAYEVQPAAFFIGARPGVLSSAAEMEMALSPLSQIETDEETGEATHVESFDRLTEFYSGWVDEVRVWDGARSTEDIFADCRKRYSQDDVEANRLEVYNLWKPVYNTEEGDTLGAIVQPGATRNTKDGLRNLPAELVMHYNFQAIPGAVNAEDVALVAPGFTANVLAGAQSDYISNAQIDTTGFYENYMSLKGGDEDGGVAGGNYEGRDMPDGLTVGWWWSTDLKSTVYSDYHVVPWIKNTVGHLPVLDGSCVDTFLYGNVISAAYTPSTELGLGEYTFPNTAVPYPSVVYAFDRYQRLRQAVRAREAYGFYTWQDQVDRYKFHLRSKFAGTSDLVPLGGAYVKACTAMWDGAASTAWEFTKVDTDGDGMPDWWEEYARNNYCEDLDPSQALGWATMITYRGTRMTAGQAYLIDVALGIQPDGETDSSYAQLADGDGNGIPDWWQKMFGVDDASAFADSDGDGLTDYAEYLLSFVFDTGKIFDPKNPRSIGSYELDYFYPVGSLYAGEIFTDHDLMEDAWETKFDIEKYVNPYRWDAASDKDEDGWSAFAECRYNAWKTSTAADKVSHMVGSTEVKDMPIPTLKLTLRYNLSRSTAGGGNADGGEGEDAAATDAQVVNTMAPVVVRTYTTSPLREELVVPDASFTIAPGTDSARLRSLGNWRDGIARGTLTPGYVNSSSLAMWMVSVSQQTPYSWTSRTTGRHYRDTYANWLAERNAYGATIAGESTAGTAEQRIFDGSEVADGVAGPLLSVTTDATGTAGTLKLGTIDQGTVEIGTIDLTTGEYAIDLSVLAELTVTVTPEGADAPVRSRLFTDETLADSELRLGYTSHVPALQSGKLDLYLGEPNSGWVKEGENRIVAFIDLNGDGAYFPGEPLAYADGVDVGWNQGAVEMELTDTSPIITRAALNSMGGDDEGGGDNTATTDRWTLYGTEDGDVRDLVSGSLSGGEYQRFRIVRTLVNGYSITDLGVPNTVVVDKWVNLGRRTFFFEGDVLGDGEYDIDWSTFQSEVAEVVPGMDVTNVTYRIVLGNGTVDATTTNNLFSVATVRHFDPVTNRTVPTAVTPGSDESIVFGSRPVFKWTTGTANTYTAFHLQIRNGNSVVWDSGVRSAPARASDGTYTFSPNVYAGDQLEKGVKYTWRVSMLNAKYQTDAWSNSPSFYVNTIETGASYGTIDVCTRYYGPSLANGVIRVEAFTTPDFSGDPVTRATVTNTDDVADFDARHVKNVTLKGLTAGTYYVRAYLDMTSRGTSYVKDDYEAWGYACPRSRAPETMFSPDAIVVSAGAAAGSVVTVHLEDVDLNANGLPDSWEMAKYGSLESGAASIDTTLAGDIAVNSTLVTLVERSDSTGVPSGLAAQVMTTLSSSSFAALALGAEVVEDSISITGVQLDAAAGTVTLTVAADVVNTATSSALYTFKSAGVMQVTCTVWGKASLAEAGWTKVAEVPVTIGDGAAEVTASLGEGVDLSSGFFKVTIEQ